MQISTNCCTSQITHQYDAGQTNRRAQAPQPDAPKQSQSAQTSSVIPRGVAEYSDRAGPRVFHSESDQALSHRGRQARDTYAATAEAGGPEWMGRLDVHA